MAFNPDDQLNVVIPYKTLCELLEASRQLQEVYKELKSTNRQVAALRGQLLEVIDKIRTL